MGRGLWKVGGLLVLWLKLGGANPGRALQVPPYHPPPSPAAWAGGGVIGKSLSLSSLL